VKLSFVQLQTLHILEIIPVRSLSFLFRCHHLDVTELSTSKAEVGMGWLRGD